MASIDFLRTIPAVALVPIAVLTFGPVRTAEVALATYAALWPIVLHTAGGVAAVHPRQYDVARMLHLGPSGHVRKIVVPAAVPAWLVGARMAVIIALLVAIVAEMMMSSQGSRRRPHRVDARAGAGTHVGLRRGLRSPWPAAQRGPAARRPPRASRRTRAVTGDQPTPTPPITALRGLLPSRRTADRVAIDDIR